MTGPVDTARGAVVPLGPNEVALAGGVLGHWQRRTRATTIPHGIRMLERDGALDNVRRLVGRSDAPFRGMVFQDSDIGKTLEAVAWELGRRDDPELRRFYDETVALLEEAQEDDGYLDSAFQRADRVQERWSDLTAGHELYVAGHLIQAAIAARRAIGDDRLLGVALRLADLIVTRFGAADSGAVDGHPEIEYALVELFRLTGRQEYLDLARAFIDRRGHGWLGSAHFGSGYLQDDVPVRDTTVLRGHAVRAIYLAAGATDVAIETGDAELLAVMRAQWADLLSRRSYITGGAGSRHRDESFGDAYELPPDRAYAETCAGIALLHWAWRMLLATGEAGFGDAFETALYNVVAAGVSDDGEHFFYSNPLQLRADHIAGQEEATARRRDWYACACCPPNLMRTFASIESYLAVARDGGVGIVNYAPARISLDTPAGRAALEIETAYPADGAVRIRVTAGAGGPLALRFPGWAAGAELRVDGAAREVAPVDGWLVVEEGLRAGTVVELTLPMSAEVVAAHPRADAIRGTVAVRRGPVVYCLEQTDNAGDVEAMSVDPTAAPEPTGDATELGPLLRATGTVRSGDADAPLYAPYAVRGAGAPAALRLRPYATWGNGAPGAMRVWIPTS